MFHDGPFDLSATVKAYFALKMIGDLHLMRLMMQASAKRSLPMAALRKPMCSRAFFSHLYGDLLARVTDHSVEIILLPRWFPVHLSKMSYWARTVSLRPCWSCRPCGQRLAIHEGAASRNCSPPADWLQSAARLIKTAIGRRFSAPWIALSSLRTRSGPLPCGSVRYGPAWRFVDERLNGEDGLGAIYPAMANSVMMYDALGYPPGHPERELARRAVEKLLVIKGDEAYCQPCVSPVWDTALVCHALMEVGGTETETPVRRSLEWLAARQVLDVKGDWATERPEIRPGGWAFQYNNAHYPDLDDTAVVVMVFDRARKDFGAPEWIKRKSSPAAGNGDRTAEHQRGWGAFDAENNLRASTSTTSPSPITARCSILPRLTSRPAASARWRQLRGATTIRRCTRRSTILEPGAQRTAAGSAAGVSITSTAPGRHCAPWQCGRLDRFANRAVRRGGVAHRHPEPRRRLGRGCEELQIDNRRL